MKPAHWQYSGVGSPIAADCEDSASKRCRSERERIRKSFRPLLNLLAGTTQDRMSALCVSLCGLLCRRRSRIGQREIESGDWRRIAEHRQGELSLRKTPRREKGWPKTIYRNIDYSMGEHQWWIRVFIRFISKMTPLHYYEPKRQARREAQKTSDSRILWYQWEPYRVLNGERILLIEKPVMANLSVTNPARHLTPWLCLSPCGVDERSTEEINDWESPPKWYRNRKMQKMKQSSRKSERWKLKLLFSSRSAREWQGIEATRSHDLKMVVIARPMYFMWGPIFALHFGELSILWSLLPAGFPVSNDCYRNEKSWAGYCQANGW